MKRQLLNSVIPILTLISTLSIPYLSAAQTISLVLSVTRTSGGALISFEGYDGYPHSYWLPDDQLAKLDYALHKSLEWSEINTTQRMEFSKDICKISLIEKKAFDTYGYNPDQADVATLIFNGKNNGGSTFNFSFYNPHNFRGIDFYFEDEGTLHIISEIEGVPFKPKPSKVDEIFH